MDRKPSTDYEVDNRYRGVKNASDNESGKRFLEKFLSAHLESQRPSLTEDRQGEGRFLMSGPGDATYSFKNAYAARRSPIARRLAAAGQ